MRAGTLRRKVKIQKRNREVDEGGGTSTGWIDYQTALRAKIVSHARGETIIAGRLAGLSTHEIHLRLSSRTIGITNLMRLVEGSAVHEIKSVHADERRRLLILMTQTGGRSD